MKRWLVGLGVGMLAVACSSGATSASAPAQGVDAAARSVPTLAGCPLFPADNPWRRDISQASVSRHSAAWVRSVGLRVHLHADFGENQRYGIPFETVPGDQPKVPIRFTA